MVAKPKILLSGATGMIGTLLAEVLLARGVGFRAMVRSQDKRNALAKDPRVTPVEGDFDDASSLESALQGVERAFLLTNSSERAERQQLSFIAACKSAGVAHVVKLSQFAAKPDSPVRFLRYHAAAEAALRESGMRWSFVRPNLILQAYLPFAEQIKKGALQAPIGDSRVSVADARDIATVVAAALSGGDEHANKIYNVTGPAAVSHAEIAASVGRGSGHSVVFQSTPPTAFEGALTHFGMPEWQAAGLIEDYAHYDRGEAAEVSDDVERVTGARARSLDDFARDYARAFE